MAASFVFLFVACRDRAAVHGSELAARYCASCHALPSPELLDKKSWENGVLPQMGPRLGIFQYMNKRYPNNIGDPNVGRSAYPDSALVSVEDWKDILAYYIGSAPDSLPAQKRPGGLRVDTSDFVVSAVGSGFSGGGAGSGAAGNGAPPATCFVRWEPKFGGVLTSDILTHRLEVWDGGSFRKKDSFLIGGAIADMVASDSIVCNMGPFGPNNAPAGHIDRLSAPIRIAATGRPLPIVYDSLLRPVGVSAADLNGDGRQDFVVSEFGYIKGELCWLEDIGGGRYSRHVLRATPGAIRTVIQDANGDGRPDIWALFAQGDEGIVLYTNEGNGRFSSRSVLRFPPSYGSSYFELADLNKDGLLDIVYTCGDNADFSTVLKPYHGVYIYLNDGHGEFTQQYFFPINGCYRAMARDFDGDGDLDLACIAYFADFRSQPSEGFVYLKNAGGSALKFEAFSVPGTEKGRWITMDVADVDGDGRLDILLANCSVGPSFIPSATDWKKGPPFLVLKNVARK